MVSFFFQSQRKQTNNIIGLEKIIYTFKYRARTLFLVDQTSKYCYHTNEVLGVQEVQPRERAFDQMELQCLRELRLGVC